MCFIFLLLFVVVLLVCVSYVEVVFKLLIVVEVQVFMDWVEVELSELFIEGNYVGWLQQIYINEDLVYVLLKVQECVGLWVNQLVIVVCCFDKFKLLLVLVCKFMLFKFNGMLIDLKLVVELMQIVVVLDGMYGKGKYCFRMDGKDGICLGIEEIEVCMVKLCDLQELLDLWIGWYCILLLMCDKYVWLVELFNQGVCEFGFKDIGEFWCLVMI